MTIARFAGPLADWLPAQRWFGGKGRPITGVELIRTIELVDRLDEGGPVGLLTLAEVRFADGPAQLYQVPIGLRAATDHAPIGTIDGLVAYDGAVDPELLTELLRLIARDEWRSNVHFGLDAGGGHAFAIRRGMPVRALGAEQSNTSVVFGERFVLKLFRRLTPGANPDLELNRALSSVHSQHIAPLLGAIETVHGGNPLALGILSSFAASAVDGWQLATTHLRDLLRGSGEDFGAEAGRLGQAVAAVHSHLAAALGSDGMSDADAVLLKGSMLDKLDSAVRDAPALAEHAGAAKAVFRAATGGHSVQRIHGDLHLGQVLRTPNRWLLVDFEGEPAAPLAERVVAQSPLRDVAGMLRSFDYAAATELRNCGHPDRNGSREIAGRWLASTRDAFLCGYADAAGVDLRAHANLLAAYELDKAVYEVRYETRNRPHLVELPLSAVRRLTAGTPHEVSAPHADLFE